MRAPARDYGTALGPTPDGQGRSRRYVLADQDPESVLVQYAQLAVRAAGRARSDVRIREGDAGLVITDRVRAAHDRGATSTNDDRQ